MPEGLHQDPQSELDPVVRLSRETAGNLVFDLPLRFAVARMCRNEGSQALSGGVEVVGPLS